MNAVATNLPAAKEQPGPGELPPTGGNEEARADGEPKEPRPPGEPLPPHENAPVEERPRPERGEGEAGKPENEGKPDGSSPAPVVETPAGQAAGAEGGVFAETGAGAGSESQTEDEEEEPVKGPEPKERADERSAARKKQARARTFSDRAANTNAVWGDNTILKTQIFHGPVKLGERKRRTLAELTTDLPEQMVPTGHFEPGEIDTRC